MKRFSIFLFLVMLAGTAECSLWSLLGFSPKISYKREYQDLQNSTNKKFADNKLEISALRNANIKLQNEVEIQLKLAEELQLRFDVKAVGYDKSVKMVNELRGNRDAILNQVNDSKLMGNIFKGQRNMALTIILALIAALKFMYSGGNRRCKEKDEVLLSKCKMFNERLGEKDGMIMKLVLSGRKYKHLYEEKVNPAAAKRKKEYRDNQIKGKT